MLSKAERVGVIEHMNADHADALADIARAQGGFADARSAALEDIGDTEMTLRASAGADERLLTIPLAEPIETLSDARRVLIRMTRAAREDG